jgi:hypothetical protein
VNFRYIKHKSAKSAKSFQGHLNRVKLSAQPVRGDVLSKALDDLDLWGEQFSIVITKMLQANGLVFDAHHCYSLRDIEKQLQRLLGRETTRHIRALIEIGIRVQYFSY